MFVGCGILDAIEVAFTDYYLRFTGCMAKPKPPPPGDITVSGVGSKVYLDGCGEWFGNVSLAGANSQLILLETVITTPGTIYPTGTPIETVITRTGTAYPIEVPLKNVIIK